MNKSKSLAVFIGRFSPVHHGHLHVMSEAIDNNDKLLILVGSSNQCSNTRNPWNYQSRVDMIKMSLRDYDFTEDVIESNVIFESLEDYIYQDNMWIQMVQGLVAKHQTALLEEYNTEIDVRLYGHKKDETSWYLEAFPHWGKVVEIDNLEQLNSTDIRNAYFDNPSLLERQEFDMYVTQGVEDYLFGKMKTKWYQYVLDEYKFQKEHDAMWENSPYPPTFNTADSIVVQSGHVLIVTRGGMPNPMTLALPGGYIDTKSSLLDNAIRELREETGLKIPEKVLKGSITHSETFDDPKRSSRGRIITQVFVFELDNSQPLAKVKGNDDALKAEWIPLNKLKELRAEFFEDHYHILRKLLNL